MKELLRLAMENAKLKKKIRDLLEENAELKQGLRCAYNYINRRIGEAVEYADTIRNRST